VSGRQAGRDDAGSMPVALLLIMIGTSISALLAASSAARTVSVRHVTQRQQLLAAAQSGFDVAVARIRAAVDGSGNGLRTALPCGPYGGAVDSGDRAQYAVTITYKSVGNTVIPCTSDSGTGSVPAYADLVATGTDPVTGAARVLTSRYTIRTSNQNIAGGLVRMVATMAGSTVCFDAGSATPAAGTALYLRPCVSGSKQQTFAYTTLLQLSLVSSATDAVPQGLCADGGPVPHPSTAVVVTMQPCLTTSPARQQWSSDDLNYYQGTSDGVNLDSHCLDPQVSGAASTPVVVAPTCGYDFNPDTTVGAGAAGASTGQLVNYAEFGRCLDVAEYNWQRNFFWIWPCKQAPTPAGVSWNQKWTLPTIVSGPPGSTGFVVNNPTTVSYPTCLQSPLSDAVNSYVTLVKCPSGTATGALKWTVHGDTGVYATSYTIVDSAGNCLAAKDPAIPGGTVYAYGHNVSPAVTVTCSGSTLEKWNADPNVLRASPLTLVTER
jgi:hypothetical protein